MILLTGGSGTLGTELQKHIKCWAPSREELDITKKRYEYKSGVHLIVHCAAYTDVAKAEKEKILCYRTNVIGTRNLANWRIPMLYISTEYVFDGEKGNYSEDEIPNPVNFYGLTKLLGEYESQATKSVIIRTLFKPTPFPHPKGITDQWTTGSTVERIAKEIVIAIKNFDRLPRILNIGHERISVYDLARKTRAVSEIKRNQIGVKLPRDTSLNLTKWRKFKDDNRLC